MTRMSSAAISFLACAWALQCEDAFDCNLNGQCSGGVCVCRGGWLGPDCGTLDLLPAPVTPAFYRAANSSWGGSVVQDEAGAWHIFIAYMLGSCGLNAWQQNSAIFHAQSSSGTPAGPYVNETLVWDFFSHNPTVTKAPDGSWLIWHIGCGGRQGNGPFNNNCTNGTTPPPPPPPPRLLKNGDQCLISAGAFPCWTGGTGKVCPAVMGSCAAPSAGWQISGSSISNVAGGALNIDCNRCEAGRLVKIFGAGASPLSLVDGQLQASDCPGMCLSTGVAIPPCGGGGEPYQATQAQLAPCGAAGTMGWTSMPAPGGDTAAAAPISAAPRRAAGAAYPAPCSDTNVLVSRSVWGPWAQTGILNGTRAYPIYETDNPAPIHFANGSTWIMARSWHPPGNTTTPIGIARSTSPSWNSTYAIRPETVPQFPSPRNRTLAYIPLEDPFMWVDEAQNFHALFHNMGGCKEVGCHAFSEDGYTWFLGADAYTTTIALADGTNKTVARRERPHIVLNSKGQIAWLTNGVQDAWGADHSYTLVQQINVPWP